MEDKLKARLESLREEFTQGTAHLEQLETQAAETRQTLLRISGAIQVLQEELGETPDEAGA